MMMMMIYICVCVCENVLVGVGFGLNTRFFATAIHSKFLLYLKKRSSF